MLKPFKKHQCYMCEMQFYNVCQKATKATPNLVDICFVYNVVGVI